MFLSHFDIRLDCRRRRLIFPPELEAQRDWIPDIALKASRLMYPKPSGETTFGKKQKDRTRKKTARPISSRSLPRYRNQQGPRAPSAHGNIVHGTLLIEGMTWEDEPSTGGHRVERPCQKDIRPRYQRRAQDLDILMISAPAFHAGIRRRKDHRHAYEDVTFLNLHMIDKALGERGEQDNQQDEDDRFLAEKLPPELADLADVFSREDSNRMPPLNREQLETMKEYLQDTKQRTVRIPRIGTYPLISETLDRIAKAKIFTKLDIRQAFHRIRLEPDSVELTAFRTRYGQFHYKVLPFGLCNGPSTFQRFINTTLWDYLDSFCTAYLDDILVFSEDKKEHMRHVRLVLERLREAGLQVDIKKCEFGVTKTDFLGFIISTDGISVDPRKVSAILTWQTPRCKKELQSFLGFCNFYRRESRWDFDDRCLEAFETLKTALTTAPVLVHFIEDRETKLETDASDGRTMDNGTRVTMRYDKELLAIIIFTDHQALQYFATKRMLNARQARWIETLAMVGFEIHYRPGKQNVVADALSRKAQDVQLQKALKELNRSQILIPATQFAGARQEGCYSRRRRRRRRPYYCHIYPGSARQAETPNSRDGCLLEGFELIEAILQANRASPSLRSEEQAEIPDSRFQVQSGLLCYDGRLVVPDEANLRTALCHEAHRPRSQAHPGRNKMRKILTRRYYWLGIGGFIDRYCANCADCKHGTTPATANSGAPWQHISMDFKTMPRDKKGYTAQEDVLPTDIYDLYRAGYGLAFLRAYLEDLRRTGDHYVRSRAAVYFELWNELCRLVGTKMKLSTAEHPQTDAPSYLDYYQDNCIGLAPAELEMGYLPRIEQLGRTAAQQFASRAAEGSGGRETLLTKQAEYKRQADKRRREVDWEVGDLVYLKKGHWSTGRPRQTYEPPRRPCIQDCQGKLQYQVSWKVGTRTQIAWPSGPLSCMDQAAATDQVALDTPDDDLPTQRQDNTKMRRRRARASSPEGGVVSGPYLGPLGYPPTVGTGSPVIQVEATGRI
ncbi:reverse transcriptase (RNA-dependent DNA polymerase) [Hirsutella rhossiliensis]